MNTIGLIGGMSYESTTTYYELINKLVNEKLDCLNSAKIVLTSVNFSEIELLQRQNRWDKAAVILSNQAKILQNSGCDFILICTRSMIRWQVV